MQEISIGILSTRAGVKIPTIRYYEQAGLMPTPIRTEAGRRTYGDTAIRRLQFIRHARELGFEVDAIRTLLSLQDNPGHSCAEADEIARARLNEVERRIASLRSLRAELKRMVDECATGRVCDCRVIETLADQSHKHGRLA